MFPESWSGKRKQQLIYLHLPASVFQSAPSCFFPSPVLRLGATPVGFLSRARYLLARGSWLSDTATLTELSHVTAFLAEHLT